MLAPPIDWVGMIVVGFPVCLLPPDWKDLSDDAWLSSGWIASIALSIMGERKGTDWSRWCWPGGLSNEWFMKEGECCSWSRKGLSRKGMEFTCWCSLSVPWFVGQWCLQGRVEGRVVVESLINTSFLDQWSLADWGKDGFWLGKGNTEVRSISNRTPILSSPFPTYYSDWKASLRLVGAKAAAKAVSPLWTRMPLFL